MPDVEGETSATHQCTLTCDLPSTSPTPSVASSTAVRRPRGRGGCLQLVEPQRPPAALATPSQLCFPCTCNHSDLSEPMIVVFGGCIGERLHIRFAANTTDELPGHFAWFAATLQPELL
jgi:hypothetical protein